MIDRRVFIAAVADGVMGVPSSARAQQPANKYRVGIVHEGGPFAAAVDGLKQGLQEFGYAEGKHYILEIRDLQGDRKAAEEAGRSLERDKVSVIFVLATSLVMPVKRATTEVPIVFGAGTDPVVAGLVQSFAQPGGRLTGVNYQQSADLMAKRLEILKAIAPSLRRVVTFYDPSNPTAVAAAVAARDAARQLQIDMVERHVASVAELRSAVAALKPQEADAYCYTNDAMVASQAQFIIDAARAKRLPTMFAVSSLAAQGALAGYGTSYFAVGRLAAKYVHRILTGTRPEDLPIEALSRVELAVNLKTARQIGVTVPRTVLVRADEVIQ